MLLRFVFAGLETDVRRCLPTSRGKGGEMVITRDHLVDDVSMHLCRWDSEQAFRLSVKNLICTSTPQPAFPATPPNPDGKGN